MGLKNTPIICFLSTSLQGRVVGGGLFVFLVVCFFLKVKTAELAAAALPSSFPEMFLLLLCTLRLLPSNILGLEAVNRALLSLHVTCHLR